MNKIEVVGILVVIIVAISSFSLGRAIPENVVSESVPLDIPSKCYTTLQPTNVLSSGRGNLIINDQMNYFRVDTNRYIFDSQVADTGSMRPTISDRADIVYIKPTTSELFVGDIIAFNCSDKLMLHRIIEISNGEYITKGDNNDVDDKTAFNCSTKFEDIKGKVVAIIY
jgi:signal peptidase I